MTFTIAERGTAPALKPKPALAPLVPSRSRWLRKTVDGEWQCERLENAGTTWIVTHLPTKTIVCDYLTSLQSCRIYIATGEAAEDLKDISEKEGTAS